MDICYYQEQIKEELDGAMAYTNKAICEKSEHPDWAIIYIKMAEAELDHASNLVKIFEDDYKQNAGSDPIYKQIHDSILKMHSEFATKAKYMLNIYSSK